MAVASKPADDVQESDKAVVLSAEIVGNAFARQYYEILEQTPWLVYRFYQDTSKMGRAEDGSIMSSTTTMDAINEKTQSYGSLKACIKCVDAQQSYNGGIIVLVTGSMVNKDDSRRDFTQTFFLAPQDKGYYVLNDIFRYMEDDHDVDEEQDGGTSHASSNQEEASPVPENHVAEQSNGEVYNPCENGEVKVKGEKDRVLVQEEKPVANVIGEAPCESWVVVESNVKVYTTPKKSYASIVMKDGFATVSSPAHSKPVSKIQDQEVRLDAASVAVAIPPSSNTEIIGNDSNKDPEGAGVGRSIHVRNLPYYVPRSQVEEVFQRFGPIMSDGVQIRHNIDGFCFGFVEFETVAAAKSAIKASPVNIDGYGVVVEEKRSKINRDNRGRYPSSIGFQRGGGRGYGRGESNKGDYLGRGRGRGSGRGYPNPSDVYMRTGHSGNGSRPISRDGRSRHLTTKP